eukprot:9486594-Pyramimonas_sp.AAC.1
MKQRSGTRPPNVEAPRSQRTPLKNMRPSAGQNKQSIQGYHPQDARERPPATKNTTGPSPNRPPS